MDSWTGVIPIRRGFYRLEGCADPNQARACVLELVGASMATLAAMDGKDEIGPVWELFGLAKGDPALELVQFKETASALMQVVQESLDATEKKLRASQAELESAQRSNKEMEALIESTQMRAAEAVNKLEARVNELTRQESDQTRKIQEQASVIEKLRAELQTAQAKVAPASKQDTASPELSAELTRLKALVAEQEVKIKRYADAMETCFDDETRENVLFIVNHYGNGDTDPQMRMHLRNAAYAVRHSMDNRVRA